MSKTETDPYKKVWNSAEDEESTLLEWVKNGTLFTLNWEELARRHVQTARYLLRKAREQESKAVARKIFKDALFHRNMAEMSYKEHRKVLTRSR